MNKKYKNGTSLKTLFKDKVKKVYLVRFHSKMFCTSIITLYYTEETNLDSVGYWDTILVNGFNLYQNVKLGKNQIHNKTIDFIFQDKKEAEFFRSAVGEFGLFLRDLFMNMGVD